MVRVSTLLLVMSLSLPLVADDNPWCTPEARKKQSELEHKLQSVPSADSLRKLHDLFSSAPHPAGTPGDEEMITTLVSAFEEMGLETERHRFWAYLPEPVSARLEIVGGVDLPGPEGVDGSGPTRTEAGHLRLPIQEDAFAEDPYTSDERLTHGWNAYSGSGSVTAGVVYANYGTLEDFQELKRMGHDLTGKIVIARYGKNYRGYKAKFAEEAGAAGLIMYTDPADSGFKRGNVYPIGGWANGSYIQRGSVKTVAYAGDPLTPGIEATRDAKRLDPNKVALPKIPIQPIGYRAASEILIRMKGNPAPESWQGGLPLDYHITSGSELQVRLDVRQRRRIRESANVFAKIEGARHPEQVVIVGCHHDAWTFGSGDPQSGTILVYEVARCFAAAARAGFRPDRTILFANWGAEEYGIIGSTEWVEGRADRLRRNAIAYINLDMATMGPNFRSSSAPVLQTIIASATKDVPHPGGGTVHEDWLRRQKLKDGDTPRFGDLGGGSDHIALYCHLGVPCAGIGAGGSDGVSYHSNYETLAWYRKVVGNDYKPAVMLTKVVNLIAARLANASILPIDPVTYAENTRRHLDALLARAGEREVEWPQSSADQLREAVSLFEIVAANVMDGLRKAAADGSLGHDQIDRSNQILLRIERTWLASEGLPSRPWFRNLYAASDPHSGYAAWMLPSVRHAIEIDGNVSGELDRCRSVFGELTRKMMNLDGILAESSPTKPGRP